MYRASGFSHLIPPLQRLNRKQVLPSDGIIPEKASFSYSYNTGRGRFLPAFLYLFSFHGAGEREKVELPLAGNVKSFMQIQEASLEVIQMSYVHIKGYPPLSKNPQKFNNQKGEDTHATNKAQYIGVLSREARHNLHAQRSREGPLGLYERGDAQRI